MPLSDRKVQTPTPKLTTLQHSTRMTQISCSHKEIRSSSTPKLLTKCLHRCIRSTRKPELLRTMAECHLLKTMGIRSTISPSALKIQPSLRALTTRLTKSTTKSTISTIITIRCSLAQAQSKTNHSGQLALGALKTTRTPITMWSRVRIACLTTRHQLEETTKATKWATIKTIDLGRPSVRTEPPVQMTEIRPGKTCSTCDTTNSRRVLIISRDSHSSLKFRTSRISQN